MYSANNNFDGVDEVIGELRISNDFSCSILCAHMSSGPHSATTCGLLCPEVIGGKEDKLSKKICKGDPFLRSESQRRLV